MRTVNHTLASVLCGLSLLLAPNIFAESTLTLTGQSAEDAYKAVVTLNEQKVAATKEFLGINWSLGVGVATDLGSGPRVDEASVVNGIVRVDEENSSQPRVFLEVHMFGVIKQNKENPKFGQSPWVGVQSSTDDVLDAVAAGWMWGWRKTETDTSSLNLGVGLALDWKVQVLGDGIHENEPLPAGETEVRFKKESRLAAVLLASFTF